MRRSLSKQQEDCDSTAPAQSRHLPSRGALDTAAVLALGLRAG